MCGSGAANDGVVIDDIVEVFSETRSIQDYRQTLEIVQDLSPKRLKNKDLGQK